MARATAVLVLFARSTRCTEASLQQTSTLLRQQLQMERAVAGAGRETERYGATKFSGQTLKDKTSLRGAEN